MNNETLKIDLCARLNEIPLFECVDLESNESEVLPMTSIDLSNGDFIISIGNMDIPIDEIGNGKETGLSVMPILFPTSALTKPIQISNYNNGEQFVPIVELLSVMYFKDAYRFNKAYIDGNNHILSGFWDSSNEHEFKFVFNDEVQSFSLFDKIHKRVNGVLSMFDLLNQWHINYRLSPEQFIEVTEEFNPYL